MESLDVYKFLNSYNLPELNQEDRNNPNRPIASNKIRAATFFLQRQQLWRTDGFIAELHQTLNTPHTVS